MASIRRARPEDLGAIVDMRIAFERITRDSGSMDEAARRAELASLLGPDLESGGLAAWIAEEGGRAVGQSALRFPPAPARGREAPRPAAASAELINVYVEPAFRGRGLGTALVAAAIGEARRLALKRIALQPTADSRRIYERAGFEAEGEGMALSLGGEDR